MTQIGAAQCNHPVTTYTDGEHFFEMTVLDQESALVTGNDGTNEVKSLADARALGKSLFMKGYKLV